jgi:hypothetical protein
MRKICVGLAISLAALVLGFAPVAYGAEFLVPDQEANGNVTVSSSETHRNLYVAGSNTTVNAATSGDLYAAGGTVVISGDVEQDLTTAGGNVVVNSQVGGDARVAGGSVNLNGPIAGDLLVAGGTVVLGEKATIGGDLIVCGGSVTVNGAVTGSVRAMGGDILINSAVAGPITVRADKSLVFGAHSVASNSVTYHGPKPAVIQDGAQVSQVNYSVWQGNRKGGARHAVGRLFTAVFLFKLIAYIIAGLLLLRFLKRPAYAVVNHAYSMPWSNLGIGFLSLIVLPILALILALTFVGFYVALVLGLFFVLTLAVSAIIGAMFAGALVIKWLVKKPNLVLDWQAVLIGCVLLSIVGFIPVVGWLVCAGIILMTFGASMRLAWQWLGRQRSMPVTE